MSKSAKGARRNRGGRSYLDDIDLLLAILLVIGYLEVGVVNVANGTLSFTLRGPALGRLTSGGSLRLSSPGTGLVAQSYLRIEALIAYLLFIGEAQIDSPGIASSTTIWTVSSKWFELSALQSLLKDNHTTFIHRTAILILLNLAIGIALIRKKIEFVITGFGLTPDSAGRVHLRFFVSGPPLTRRSGMAPGKYTPPPFNHETLYWMGAVLGILLISQQARVMNVGAERGGALGFDVSTFQFKGLPINLQKALMSLRR